MATVQERVERVLDCVKQVEEVLWVQEQNPCRRIPDWNMEQMWEWSMDRNEVLFRHSELWEILDRSKP